MQDCESNGFMCVLKSCKFYRCPLGIAIRAGECEDHSQL